MRHSMNVSNGQLHDGNENSINTFNVISLMLYEVILNSNANLILELLLQMISIQNYCIIKCMCIKWPIKNDLFQPCHFLFHCTSIFNQIFSLEGSNSKRFLPLFNVKWWLKYYGIFHFTPCIFNVQSFYHHWHLSCISYNVLLHPLLNCLIR